MKNLALFLILLQIFSCVSTKNVAESRNSEIAAQNNFEIYRFWRELDILRLNNALLNVRILLIPEGITANAFESDSQMIHINDSLSVMIGEKIKGFQELKKVYSDTTDKGRINLYKTLKSDSTDKEFLKKIANSSYFELYEDIVLRFRKSIQASKFYSSFAEFDSYVRNRSIEIMDKHLYEEIFGFDTMSTGKLSENQFDKLKQYQIDFIIFFSSSYNINYSERAGSRLGSESIHLKLIDTRTATTVTTATLTHYWGNE